jgi:hypothetical protein
MQTDHIVRYIYTYVLRDFRDLASAKVMAENHTGRQTLQKKNHTRRNFAPEINQAIHEEVEKLLQADFI